VTFTVGTIVEREVRAGILFEVDNPVESVWYKYGLRLKDIPETAWNLLPLSFMVDHFINISQTIRGITNLTDPSVKNLAAWITTKSNTVKTTSMTALNESGYTSSVTPDLIYEKTFTYSREVWMPGLEHTVPGIDFLGLVNSAAKITDLSALIVANFSLRRK
jgi:hypothetical protein